MYPTLFQLFLICSLQHIPITVISICNFDAHLDDLWHCYNLNYTSRLVFSEPLMDQPHCDTLPDSISQQTFKVVHYIPALPEDTQNTSPDQNSFRTNPTLSANSTNHHVAHRLQHIPQSLQVVSQAPALVETEDIAIYREVSGLPAPSCLSLLTSPLVQGQHFCLPMWNYYCVLHHSWDGSQHEQCFR